MKDPKKLNTGSTPLYTQNLLSLLDKEGCRSNTLLALLVTIIVLSTVLLVMAAIFIGSFKLQLLTMASGNFLTAPVIMIFSNVVSIIFSIAGCVITMKKHVQMYSALSASSGMVFILQIIAVVFSFLLRGNIIGDLNKVNIDSQLKKAVKDETTMAVWDTLQVKITFTV